MEEAMVDEADPDDERGVDIDPIENQFDFAEDPVDFMSAESFPASDPLPPPSALAPSHGHPDESEGSSPDR